MTNSLTHCYLPATSPQKGQENNHDGGKVVIGPDQNVYVVIGDVGGRNGQAQNNGRGDPVDGSSGILRVTQGGLPVGEGFLVTLFLLGYTMHMGYEIVSDLILTL